MLLNKMYKLLFLVFFLNYSLFAETASIHLDLDEVVYEALQKFNVPGCAIGVIYEDQIVVAKGYGMRELENNLPVTEHTSFPIGSCTKAFTAHLLGQLVDEGIITWDDPVKNYIPEFCLYDQERTNQVTIRDLLAHRTGIPRHDAIWISDHVSKTKLMELLKYLEPICGLREEFQYNNFMYTLSGILIERILGKPWEKILQERIFIPLNMQNSNANLIDLFACSNFSSPYAEVEGILIKVPFRDASPVDAGGGINSNILDMLNWVRFQMSEGRYVNKTVISKQTLHELHSIQMTFPAPLNYGEEIYQLGYGLGWFVGTFKGYDWITHGGDLDGFSSEVSFFPQINMGLVILTNSSSDGRYLISALRNYILGKAIGKEDSHSIKKAQKIRNQTKKALQEATISFDEQGKRPYPIPLEPYTGFYKHPAYGSLEIKVENGFLFASYGHLITPLYYKSGEIFSGKFPDLLFYGIDPIFDFTFFKDSAGKPYKIEVPLEAFRSKEPIIFIKEQL